MGKSKKKLLKEINEELQEFTLFKTILILVIIKKFFKDVLIA